MTGERDQIPALGMAVYSIEDDVVSEENVEVSYCNGARLYSVTTTDHWQNYDYWYNYNSLVYLPDGSSERIGYTRGFTVFNPEPNKIYSFYIYLPDMKTGLRYYTSAYKYLNRYINIKVDRLTGYSEYYNGNNDYKPRISLSSVYNKDLTNESFTFERTRTSTPYTTTRYVILNYNSNTKEIEKVEELKYDLKVENFNINSVIHVDVPFISNKWKTK